MASLYDLISEEDKKKVDRWAEERKNLKHATEIPPEYYLAAELGYYYGWEAKVAFSRGYNIGIDDYGKLIKLPYTFKEACADVKAAKKVKYRQIIDNNDIAAAANISSHDKNYARGVINFSNRMRRELNE